MKRWWIYAPVALCCLLMPLLAYQQYVWLGQLSVDEADRLRRGLERTAWQLQARFQLQLAALQGNGFPGRGRMGPPWAGRPERPQRPPQLDPQLEIESHYSAWKADTRFPALIQRMLLRIEDLGACRQWQPGLSEDSAKWMDAPPADCQVRPDTPWWVMRPLGRGSLLLIRLDEKETRENVLPALAQDLGLSSEDYTVSAEEGVAAKQGDVSVPLLMVPTMGRGRMGFNGPPPGGGLRLVLTRSGGSISEVVAAARWRNLAVSFLVMLILLSALLLLAWLARRSDELARRQMDFVAGVSHELRTPLAVICSAGENLADGVAVNEERVKRYGRLIASEGRHLGEMVEEILGYARGNKSPELWETFLVEDLVERAIEDSASEITASGCQLERSSETEALLVEGEKRALIHAIRNLLSNAAKYGRAGGWIGVSIRTRGKMAEIEVADRGPGFEKGEGKKIFEAFHRGKRALAEQVHGLGLGLTFVQRVAEMHGGKVEALQDGGARFRILLPLAKESNS